MKHRFVLVIALIAIFQTPFAHCDPYTWFCFSSTEGKDIKLAFAFAPNDDKHAFIKYKNGKGVINLTQTHIESETTAEGRPDLFTFTYVEKFGEKEGGTYEIDLQGANFYRFVYKAKNGTKSYNFETDIDSRDENGCSWLKRT